MRQCEIEGTAHVQRPKVSPRRARSQQPPRWSAERRASRVMGCKALRKAPAGVRHSPADGCRCTRAPVGAPLPHFVWGRTGKPRRASRLARTMMLAQFTPPSFRSHAAASSEPILRSRG